MVKFLVMDVDGTLTDGKIYMGVQGELMKSFDIKDGCGIKDILPQYGIVPVIITARVSQSLTNRCMELGITEFYQGIRNKLEKLNFILEKKSEEDHCEYDYSDVAYIGDDILDLQCMKPIKDAGGIIGCPLNAVDSVVKISDFVSRYNGGAGAVREFIEAIIHIDIRGHNIHKKVEDALRYINKLNLAELELGTYHLDKDYFMVQEYGTLTEKRKSFESHKKYVDIQYVIKGKEKIEISDIEKMEMDTPYDVENDVILWKNPKQNMECVLSEGSYVVLYPENAHNPSISVGNKSERVRKLVYKVRVE